MFNRRKPPPPVVEAAVAEPPEPPSKYPRKHDCYGVVARSALVFSGSSSTYVHLVLVCPDADDDSKEMAFVINTTHTPLFLAEPGDKVALFLYQGGEGCAWALSSGYIVLDVEREKARALAARPAEERDTSAQD